MRLLWLLTVFACFFVITLASNKLESVENGAAEFLEATGVTTHTTSGIRTSRDRPHTTHEPHHNHGKHEETHHVTKPSIDFLLEFP